MVANRNKTPFLSNRDGVFLLFMSKASGIIILIIHNRSELSAAHLF